MTPRQVLGLKRGVPTPGECAILNVPCGNTAVSTRAPEWSTPPAVNRPVAMMLCLDVVSDVVMIWKCSNPDLADAPTWLALAAVRPVPATAPTSATTPITPKILLLSFVMVHTSPLLSPGGQFAQPGH